MTVSPPAYQTRLEQEPLAEILARIAVHRVPATLTVRHESRTIEFFVDEGTLGFASGTGDPVDSFRSFIVDEGLVSLEDFDAAWSRTKQTKKTIASDLIANGVASSAGLIGAVTQRCKALVADAFDWQDGVVEFRPGRRPLPIRLAIPLGRFVLDGLQNYGEPKQLTAKVGPRSTVLRRVAQPPPYLIESELALFEFIDGRRMFEEIIRHTANPPQTNVRLVYGFRLLDLIQPKESGVKVKMKFNE